MDNLSQKYILWDLDGTIVAWVADTENPQFTKANVVTYRIDFDMIKDFFYRLGER